MNRIHLIRELEKYPIFNLKIVSEVIEKNTEYAKLVIYRLKKSKLVYEIEKNKYTTHKDPFIIASNIIWPCYISFWSALRYYNLTEQLPQTIFIITTKSRKKRIIDFYNTKIIFTKIKPKYYFGYKKEKYQDFNIFIAEKEKAVIDSALFKKVSFSEIASIVKNAKNNNAINIDLIINYLIKIKNKSLIKRFGFLFDKLGISNCEKLKKYIDYRYVPLDYAIKPKGRKLKKDKKWRIIENVRIF